jgi:hypothetical protein
LPLLPLTNPGTASMQTELGTVSHPRTYSFFNLDSQRRNEHATSHPYNSGASLIFGRCYASLYRRCRACITAFLELDRSDSRSRG